MLPNHVALVIVLILHGEVLLGEMRRKLTSVGSLVERTVEGGDEKHQHLGAHSEEKHDVCSRKVGQFEQCSEDNNRGTPAICVVEERLSGHAVHPFLHTIDKVELAVFSHSYFFFLFFRCFAVSLDELARLRTQRKPM